MGWESEGVTNYVYVYVEVGGAVVARVDFGRC